MFVSPLDPATTPPLSAPTTVAADAMLRLPSAPAATPLLALPTTVAAVAMFVSPTAVDEIA
ncbi:hypothetical protein B1T52_21820 [Mycobacterium kansasii]|nr:hypothetical protein B1T52_21820 [Mycobacterium kansasii]